MTAEPLPGMDDVPELYPVPLGPEPKPLSAGQRLTARRKAALARGVHPLTGAALRQPVGEKTCGDCALLFRQEYTAGNFWKCRLRFSRGPATDVRKSWPACRSFREVAPC